eukprot:PhF_6_TR1494/c0_g2_i1/m.2704
MITLSTMMVSTLAGSAGGNSGSQAGTPFSSTQFFGPRGLHVVGTTLYVCDTMNNEIKILNLATMWSEYYAGANKGDSTNIAATSAYLFHPSYLAVYKNRLYFSDNGNNKVKRITLINNYLTTMDILTAPQGVTSYKGYVYLNDMLLNAVYEMSVVTGTIYLFLGTQGVSGDSNTPGNELFMGLSAVYTDCLRKTLMIHDWTADKAKRYSFLTQRVTTYLGAGSFTSYNGPGPKIATSYMIDGPYGGATTGVGE